MDNSKSETYVNHEEWVVVRYIFRVIYGKMFYVINEESVCINGSK
jgi:hypothetical protein